MAEFSPDELREIQKLTESINKTMSKISDESDKRNKSLQQQANLTQQILSDLTDEESINNALRRLEVERRRNAETNYGVNRDLGSVFQMQQQLGSEILKDRIEQLKVIRRVKEESDSVADSMKGTLSSLQGMITNIPIVGGLLDKISKDGFGKMNSIIDRGARGFNIGFERSFRNITRSGGTMTQAVTGGLSNGFKMAAGSVRAMTAALMGPQLIIAGIVAILAVAVAGFVKLDEAAKEFRNTTGLTNSQMKGLNQTIQNVTISNAALGVSAEKVAKAAAEFTNQFEGLMIPSESVLKNVTALEKNFGVTASTQAKVNALFQEQAGLSAEAAQYQVAQVTQAANLAGVAPTRVLQDIANNAEAASNYFGGSVQALSKAAIQAAALGTSIKEASEVADNLLDFESSINAELEASAMLGQSINFNKARELAATGDILGAQQSVLDSLESTVDLNKLNKFQLDSIAKASGMPVAELRKQLNIRKQFGKLDADGMKAAEQLLASGKELSDISSDDLAAATAQVKKQNEMKSQMDTLKAVFGGIGSQLMMALAPLGELIIVPLINLGKLISPVIGLISKVIQAAFRPVMTVFRAVQALIQPIIKAVSGIFTEFDPIFSKFGELFDKVDGIILPVFKAIGSIIGFAFKAVAKVIGFIVSGVVGLYDLIVSPFSTIGNMLGGLGSTIMDGLSAVGPSLINFFGSIVKGWFNIITFIPRKIYEAFTSVFPTIGEYISNFFNGIIDYIKGLFDFSSIFSGISSFFGFGGGDVEAQVSTGVDVAMADGGVVTGPTKALIGEAGPEAVIPLSGVDVMGSGAIVAAIEQLGNDIKNLQVQVNMDGRKVADGVSKVVQRSNINNFGVTT